MLTAFVTVGFLSQQIVIDHVLAVAQTSSRTRTPFPADALAEAVAREQFKAPREGETVEGPTGRAQWKKLSAKADDWFEDEALVGGYVFFELDSAREQTMVLDAAGHAMVYVNGVARGGDVYADGTVKLPVNLRKGKNWFLAPVGRGRFRARLVPAAAPVSVLADDPTFPDYQVDRSERKWAAAVVQNATDQWRTVTLQARVGDQEGPKRTAVLGPLTNRKLALELPAFTPSAAGPVPTTLTLTSPGMPESKPEFTLAARAPGERYKVTYQSDIDGSVQYYSVVPAFGERRPGRALVLSIHGAGVEATSQAGAYGRKDWADIVCATNRRPYGFNWEDWGRLDAYEALADAESRLQPDPSQIYLTGHSMGGHGTWYLGLTDPDRWGAIAPCAGWISMWTYANAIDYPDPTPVEAQLRRAANVSDILLNLRNASAFGVYVLHGAEDETVPVSEARTMREKLAEFHRDVDWHEEPGGSHWYDHSDDPGADCIDYPPLFEFFRRHRRALDTDRVVFSTVSPAVNSKCHWAEVYNQERPLEVSKIDLTLGLGSVRLRGTTSNVRTLCLDTERLFMGETALAELDGQDLTLPRVGPKTWLRRDSNGAWRVAEEPVGEKSPAAYGGFKDVFRHRFALVVGTGGTQGESEEIYNRARYDAEVWWPRANGDAEIVRDIDVDPQKFADRNLVLYGGPTTNRLWNTYLDKSPINVQTGRIMIGTKAQVGKLACLVALPKVGRQGRLVGAVGAGDVSALRATTRLTYLAAATHFPDWVVTGFEAVGEGTGKVADAGFFTPDWKAPNF
ncbi:MAG: prolyl oligopeptidase family serine peptidase [Fimbriimonadaceae bacterium]|nr:prolyl oligopeptidase family serine peptidase [Fimbriimonadaceae bacterium]QYK56947.1 MAG: prolyl oligopeptidase family serine peptidase [Fimbriimonadaceae bacterium]